jgi:hypothetical protein
MGRQMFCKEALIWRQLRHPYILPFIGIDAETFRPFLCMVSPWLPHGNVLKYMEREEPLNVDIHRLVGHLDSFLFHYQNSSYWPSLAA